jgi:hypothetical protein
MPSPGDLTNLKHNLETIAELRSKPRGTKLSYDRTSGRFSLQEPGTVTTVVRFLSRDSVESEEFFGAPIRELFAAAYAQKHEDFANALRGLRHLRYFYTGEKLRRLNAVIEDAEMGVKKDPSHVVRLRERYAKYVTYGFAQVMFLPQSNGGVCYSLTVHWARRILMGKTYFGVSRQTPGEEVRLITFNKGQKARIVAKMDDTIRPMQDKLREGYGASDFGSRLMVLASDNGERFHKYGNIFVLPAVNKMQPIEPGTPGREVFRAVWNVVRTQLLQFRVFLVNFSKGEQAHTIGFHVKGYGVHFFDPNFGEFDFPEEADPADFGSFLDDWCKTFYRAGWEHWSLEGVKLRPQRSLALEGS